MVFQFIPFIVSALMQGGEESKKSAEAQQGGDPALVDPLEDVFEIGTTDRKPKGSNVLADLLSLLGKSSESGSDSVAKARATSSEAAAPLISSIRPDPFAAFLSERIQDRNSSQKLLQQTIGNLQDNSFARSLTQSKGPKR